MKLHKSFIVTLLSLSAIPMQLCLGVYDFIAIDSTNRLTIDQLEDKSMFIPATPANVQVTDTNLTYWKKIEVSFKTSNIRVLTENQSFKTIELFMHTDTGTVYLGKASLTENEGHAITKDQISFLVSSQKQKEIYYIKIKIYKSCVLSVFSFDAPQFFRTENTSGFLRGLFTGIIIIIALYSISLFVTLKERLYLNYLFYLISILLFAYVNWGLIKAVLPVNILAHYRELYTIPYMLMTISLLAYLKNYLSFRYKNKFIYNVIHSVIIIRLLIFLTGLLFDLDILYNQIIDTVIIITPLIFLWKLFDFQHKPDRIFIVAFIVVITGSSLHALNAFQFLKLQSSTPDAVYFSAIIHTVLFSISLGIKITDLQREKIEAEALSRRMSEKNRLINQARIHQKVMTFGEFSDFFADDNACYEYLAELKWKEGFICPVCENTKFSKGNVPWSRRCSKCNHIETVTNGTIFYRVRFSIQKAFYLVFRVCTGNEYSVTELAKTLDLRRATCSNFIQKVNDRMLELSSRKENKKEGMYNWMDLVMLD